MEKSKIDFWPSPAPGGGNATTCSFSKRHTTVVTKEVYFFKLPYKGLEVASFFYGIYLLSYGLAPNAISRPSEYKRSLLESFLVFNIHDKSSYRRRIKCNSAMMQV